MTDKTTVGIVFGGKSAEHEVSLQSAKNIIEAMDKEKYDVVLVGIDQKGKWHLSRDSGFLLNAEDPKQIELAATYHKRCRDCHVEKKHGPITCGACHKKGK